MSKNPPPPNEVTRLLQLWRDGDDKAMQALMTLVYDDLYARAKFYMSKERRGHTLSVTELVNEAFIKLLDDRDRDWQDRVHFYSIAARVMRNFLANYALARIAQKRGADQLFLIEDLDIFRDFDVGRFSQLEEAIAALETKYPRHAHAIDLYYFCGFQLDEVAELLKKARVTVTRDLNFARAWLRKYLKEHEQ